MMWNRVEWALSVQRENERLRLLVWRVAFVGFACGVIVTALAVALMKQPLSQPWP